MSFTNVSVLEQIRARVAKTLTAGVQLNMSTDESKKLLKRHVNKKTNVVIIFIDVNNSTVFPGEYDQAKACKNALSCTTSIQEIIREVINPAFKENGLPEISIRIGLTYGYALVVLYGNSLEKAYIDIIGSSISLASKIVSIAKPNQVLVGESIYNILLSSEER